MLADFEAVAAGLGLDVHPSPDGAGAPYNHARNPMGEPWSFDEARARCPFLAGMPIEAAQKFFEFMATDEPQHALIAETDNPKSTSEAEVSQPAEALFANLWQTAGKPPDRHEPIPAKAGPGVDEVLQSKPAVADLVGGRTDTVEYTLPAAQSLNQLLAEAVLSRTSRAVVSEKTPGRAAAKPAASRAAVATVTVSPRPVISSLKPVTARMPPARVLAISTAPHHEVDLPNVSLGELTPLVAPETSPALPSEEAFETETAQKASPQSEIVGELVAPQPDQSQQSEAIQAEAYARPLEQAVAEPAGQAANAGVEVSASHVERLVHELRLQIEHPGQQPEGGESGAAQQLSSEATELVVAILGALGYDKTESAIAVFTATYGPNELLAAVERLRAYDHHGNPRGGEHLYLSSFVTSYQDDLAARLRAFGQILLRLAYLAA